MKQKKNKIPKNRNPFVQHLINRNGGGVHVKSKKAKRQQEKMNMKKEHYDQAA